MLTQFSLIHRSRHSQNTIDSTSSYQQLQKFRHPKCRRFALYKWLYTNQCLNFPQLKKEGVYLTLREINREEEGGRRLILTSQNQHWDTISSFIYAPNSLPEVTGGSLKGWVILFSLALSPSPSLSPPYLSFSKQPLTSNSLWGWDFLCLPCIFWFVCVCLCT